MNAQQVPGVADCCADACEQLQAAAGQLMGAAVASASALQACLLTADSLSSNSFAHQVGAPQLHAQTTADQLLASQGSWCLMMQAD